LAEIGNQTAELSPKQTRAIATLLVAKDVQSAAKDAGVGERTLHTWLGDPNFRAALKEAEAQAIELSVRMLAGAAQNAIGVIVSIMRDEYTRDALRLRAAQTVLDQMVKLKQVADLEERVAILEAVIEADAANDPKKRNW